MGRLSPAEAYRLWAPTWDHAASPIVELEHRYLSAWLQDLRDKIFVDVGCGTGRWMSHALQAGAKTIGLDLSFEMLQQAAVKTGLCGRTAVADMANLPLRDESADIVLCALSLGHCADAQGVLGGLLRLARRGGHVMISDFHPDAVRGGWKRTFRCGSETMEVESHPYSVEALLEQSLRSGYRLEQLLEVSFGPEEEKIFLDAGRSDLWARVGNQAAVLLICLRRL